MDIGSFPRRPRSLWRSTGYQAWCQELLTAEVYLAVSR